MVSINSYINFNGTTEAAFNFYKAALGGEFTSLQRFKDTPEGDKLNDTDKEKIMHVALPIGDTGLLMGTDAIESMGHKLIEGNNFSLSLNAGSDAEADELFSKLSAGGKVTLPMTRMFWGAYFGMFTDQFGIQWMVSSEQPKA